jgi:hypothetical protein
MLQNIPEHIINIQELKSESNASATMGVKYWGVCVCVQQLNSESNALVLYSLVKPRNSWCIQSA